MRHIHFRFFFKREEGVDIGGLHREFWRILIKNIVEKYCIGDECKKTFYQNVPALQVSERDKGMSVMCILEQGFYAHWDVDWHVNFARGPWFSCAVARIVSVHGQQRHHNNFYR